LGTEARIKYLFQQYLANKCSRQELEELFSYIRASDQDEVVRNLIKNVYDGIPPTPSSPTYVDELGNLISTEKEVIISNAPKGSLKKKTTLPLVVVICLAIAGFATWFINDKEKHNPQTPLTALTKKNTERSEYKYLLLPDSTQVWLNASSTLEFPDHFNADKREVLLSGEAYFDVKHAEQIPFVIHTGKIATTVLGTAFNIKAYPDRKHVIVSVSSGKVKVSYDNIPVATLIHGQQAKVNSQNNTVVERTIEPTQVAAWQQGNMSYEDESFEDIVADLERLYNVRIRIDNRPIRNWKVTTSFRREIGVEQALQVLCQLTDTILRQQNGWYIIQ
jgi:transmembrane sensor